METPNRKPVLVPFLLFASAAWAQVPESTFDTLKYITSDVYDLTPDRRAEWEAGRYVNNGIWVGLGSQNYREFDAVERAMLNIPFTSWLQVHGDIRNDRDRDSAVRRLVFDLTARVLPWLWIGPAASPPLPGDHKETIGFGGAALLVDRDRTRYLLTRLVLDSYFYNQLNQEGGIRSSKVFHPQAEGRWSIGPWSLYGYLDIVTPSDVIFPNAPVIQAQSSVRAEYSLHLRYAGERIEGDARWDRLVTTDSKFGPRTRSDAHRQISTARLEGLLATFGVPSPLRLRLGLRWVEEQGRGAESNDTYQLTRHEVGFRVAGVWRRGPNVFELGYASAVVSLSLGVNEGEEVVGSPYEDKAYGSWEFSFNPRFHLRVRLTWDVKQHRFGGGNGVFLAQF
jgi:hypothetical protein